LVLPTRELLENPCSSSFEWDNIIKFGFCATLFHKSPLYPPGIRAALFAVRVCGSGAKKRFSKVSKGIIRLYCHCLSVFTRPWFAREHL